MKPLLFACVLPIVILIGCSCFAETQVLDFYAEWCGPCQQMRPIVDRLAADGVPVQRIDIDRSPELAKNYGVERIPTFVILEDGREVDRIVGAASKERIVQMVRRKDAPKPHPAWRYEKAEARFAAVVRITCQLTNRQRALGSGVLVRWADRLIVLTARHVVKDARSIVVRLATGKNIRARVIVLDGTWDCAALELLEPVEGVSPAICETGELASLKAGDVLETCGYGGDDKLAANTGRLTGFTSAFKTDDGLTDWIEISGYVRQGDSGGPVFNQRGNVVGILWGGNFREPSRVVCIQAGRMHLVLNAAVKKLGQGDPPKYRDMAVTPPAACDGNCGPGGNCAPGANPAAGTSGGYLLPYRNEIAGQESANSRKLDELLNRPMPQPPVIYTGPQGPQPPDPSGQQALQAVGQLAGQVDSIGKRVDGLTTTVEGLAKGKERTQDKGDDGELTPREQRIYDRLKSLPIQGPITRRLENNLEEGRGLLSGDDWLRDRLDFSGSIAKWIAFVVAFAVLVFVIHKRNERRAEQGQPLLPLGDKLAHGLQAAAVANPALAPVAAGFSAVHGAAERGIDFLHQRIENLESRLHKTALQTPPAATPPSTTPPGVLGTFQAGTAGGAAPVH